MNKLLSLTDAYKQSHAKFYPPNTGYVYSYLSARKPFSINENNHGIVIDYTIFFGLQYLLKKYFVGRFCTVEDVEEAKEYYNKFFGRDDVFNYDGWMYIAKNLNGILPIRINAVKEGSRIPVKNVLMTIENTNPKCYWLTNWLETELQHLWYSTIVATYSNRCRKLILDYLNWTGTPESIDYKLIDFGQRGASSYESASIGGASHLINFKGTDTLAGVNLVKEYYSNDNAYMPGNSIPATEHANITSWGKSYEKEAYENVLDKYPSGFVACVSDSYDIFNACENIWGKELRDKVLSRNGTLVIRPDSGDPVTVVTSVITILGDKFGYSINEKGFKVLLPQVRIIQGDCVNILSISKILSTLMSLGWSADNIAFGMGGALLQRVNRDDFSFAIKCSYAIVNGEPRVVSKNPITDSDKSSYSGRLSLIYDNEYRTINTEDLGDKTDLLSTIYENGKLLVEYEFEDIRNLCNDNS